MEEMNWRDAIRHPDYLFVRAFKLGGTSRPSGRSGVYHRDSTSPTGKILAATGPSDEIREALEEQRKSGPLSPTEGLGS